MSPGTNGNPQHYTGEVRGGGGVLGPTVYRVVFFETENYKMEQLINNSYCTLVLLCSYSPLIFVFNCLFIISQCCLFEGCRVVVNGGC